jgi:hypothetical protein
MAGEVAQELDRDAFAVYVELPIETPAPLILYAPAGNSRRGSARMT